MTGGNPGDGSLIAFGTRSGVDDEVRYLPSAALAWESSDGRDWQPAHSGLPDLVRAPGIVSGALGYLALIGEADYAAGGVCPTMYCGFELWYSPDGRAWEQAHSLAVDIRRVVVDAGDEGFAVAGIGGAAGQSFALASGDGRRWFEAAAPPPDITGLATIGGDWLILTGDTPTGRAQTSTAWRSANGLDWQQIGDLPLGSLVTGAGDSASGRSPSSPQSLGSSPLLVSTIRASTSIATHRFLAERGCRLTAHRG